MKIKIILFTILLSILATNCMADDVVVIINPSIAETTLNKNDLENIYLGKKTAWNNGSKINFVILTGDINELFLKNYVGKTESQFTIFWKKQVFTGKGSPPKEIDSEQAMVAYVAQTAGAIGYVSTGTDVSKVKTITLK